MSNNLKCFVRSAGLEQSQDYDWMASEPANSSYVSTIRNKEHLLDQNAPSLVICRLPEGNLLVLANLPASTSDMSQRRIRNQLAVSSADEAKIRGIAAQYLRAPEEFAKNVESYVTFDKTNAHYGWSADFARINSMLNECEPGKTGDPLHQAVQLSKYSKYSSNKTCHNQLAEELLYSPLPETAVPVLVNRDASKAEMIQNRVWRGVSDVFEHDGWRGKEALNSVESAALEDCGKINISNKTLAFISGTVAILAIATGWAHKVRHEKESKRSERVQTSSR